VKLILKSNFWLKGFIQNGGDIPYMTSLMFFTFTFISPAILTDFEELSHFDKRKQVQIDETMATSKKDPPF
jgi:hypothetical protein